jgi:hypothetical protein
MFQPIQHHARPGKIYHPCAHARPAAMGHAIPPYFELHGIVGQRYVCLFSEDIICYETRFSPRVGGRWTGAEASDRGRDTDWAWAGGQRQASTRRMQM